MVEQRTENPRVAGSIPALGTPFSCRVLSTYTSYTPQSLHVKKIKLLVVGLLVLSAGCLAVNAFFRAALPVDDAYLYGICMRTEPGSSLADLEQLFGKSTIVHNDGKATHYQFGSHEYSVLYSDYIVAYQDNESKKITRLKCAEKTYAWNSERITQHPSGSQ